MCCALCSEFDHLDADDIRAEREANQDSELDEFELAELRRDMERDDDYNPNFDSGIPKG